MRDSLAIGDRRLELVIGDITEARVDAVANGHVDPPRLDVDRPLPHAPVPVPASRRDSISTTLFWG